MKTKLLTALCALGILGADVATAHHSGAMFDKQNPVVLKGVVKELPGKNFVRNL